MSLIEVTQGDRIALSIVDRVVTQASYSYDGSNEVVCSL